MGRQRKSSLEAGIALRKAQLSNLFTFDQDFGYQRTRRYLRARTVAGKM